MKKVLAMVMLLSSLQLMAASANATARYNPRKYTCNYLNQVLQSQGYINLALGIFPARSWAQPGAHACSNSDRIHYKEPYWKTRIVNAADGACELGVYCKRERIRSPGNDD